MSKPRITTSTGPTSTRRAFSTGAGVSTLAVALGAGEALAKPAKAKELLPYQDAKQSIDARVDDLIGRMTIEEKVMQMQCVWQAKGAIQDPNGTFNPTKAAAVYPNGLGMVARPSDQQGLATTTGAGDSGGIPNRNAFETATHINAMQKWAVEQTRLGIPMIMHEESPARLRRPRRHQLPPGHRPGFQLRSRHGDAHLQPSRRVKCAPAGPISPWRRWSTWRANRAGAVSRKPTAKIRTCAAKWARAPCAASWAIPCLWPRTRSSRP